MWGRIALVAVFATAAVLLLNHQTGHTVLVYGDVYEYWYQAESFHRHGTPELWPEDVAAVNGEAVRLEIDTPPAQPYAYATSPDGRKYGVHFWTYALSGVPAKQYLRWAGRTELTWPAVTNAGWFLLAVGFTLFGSRAPVPERVALATLASVGPVLWYLTWPGAEVFSWALALVAVVGYRDGRYGLAGTAAGLSATQNPTVIFLGGAAVLAAALERRWRAAGAAAAGTAIGLTPFAFFQYHFGVPNLIAAEFSSINHMSWARTWGLLTDWNQGLLPYVPVLLAGTVIGTVRVVVRRDVRGILLAAAGVAMAVGVEVQHNWNSSCFGLQRYLVWMTPVAAGVAVWGVAGRSRLWAWAVTAASVHAAILAGFTWSHGLRGGYIDHSVVAEWVLTHCPEAYWAEPEVFVERELHRDDWPHTPADLPLGFARPDGTVSKLLLDAASVEKLPGRYDADPGYVAALRERAARESGLFYAHPPRGAVRVREETGAR